MSSWLLIIFMIDFFLTNNANDEMDFITFYNKLSSCLEHPQTNVLINKKGIYSALNCVAYSPFEGVSSDHRTVTAKICVSLCRNTKQTTKTKHYDWSLLNYRDISNKYTIALRNKCSSGDIQKSYSEWQIWELCQFPHRSSSRMHTNQTKISMGDISS